MSYGVRISILDGDYRVGSDIYLHPEKVERVGNLHVLTLLNRHNYNVSGCEKWSWGAIVCHKDTGIILSENSSSPFTIPENNERVVTGDSRKKSLEWLQIGESRKDVAGTPEELLQCVMDMRKHLIESSVKEAEDIIAKMANK